MIAKTCNSKENRSSPVYEFKFWSDSYVSLKVFVHEILLFEVLSTVERIFCASIAQKLNSKSFELKVVSSNTPHHHHRVLCTSNSKNMIFRRKTKIASLAALQFQGAEVYRRKWMTIFSEDRVRTEKALELCIFHLPPSKSTTSA